METISMSKSPKIVGWVLAGLLTALFTMSAIGKFSGAEEIVTNFSKWGLDGRQILIGAGEIISAILFLIPRTSSLGVLLLSAHMGGAIATHMGNAESFIFQSVVLVLIWVTAWVRNPSTLSSFNLSILK